MDRPAKRPRPERRTCPHCDESLSYKTFQKHKRLYYDPLQAVWLKPLVSDSEHGSDSDSEPSSVEFSDLALERNTKRQRDMTKRHSFTTSGSELSDSCPESVPSVDNSVEVWSDYLGDSCLSDQESPPLTPSSPVGDLDTETQSKALISWIVQFFLLLQAKFHIREFVVQIIFSFLKVFFVVLGRVYHSCSRFGELFPATLYQAKKKSGINQKKFKTYCVCKRCHKIWSLQACIQGVGNHERALCCPHVPFSTGRHNRKCDGPLLKTVELATGKKIFYPLHTYCFIDLHTSLQHLLLQPDFTTSSEHWRSRNVPYSGLKDVYDGRVWKSFLNWNSQSFLNEPHSFGALINVDWFQPYKHLTYSVGVIYLSWFNLPRAQRYSLKNISLIGIIPGPKEPELTLNPYIDELVSDLLKFWKGVELFVNVGSGTERKIVRCALLCASCDLPAGRKLCGFLGHMARLGCSKCKKEFPYSRTLGKQDYSGFDRHKWTPRTNISHRKDCESLLKCTSKSDLKRNEAQVGCRYSSLLKLPYFDPPTMLVIDPMHNLFLGLAKHFIKRVFIDKQIIKDSDFDVIQDRVNRITVPTDIGRIPYKIRSAFSSFTADQFKNWVVHYSVISLYGYLATEHLECWRHFVLACRILCQPRLTTEQLTVADTLLLRFCQRTERQYGKDIITPNMHMACHLHECIKDYGPLNHFWLFAFERFNGILGQLPNNNRSVEVQMMKRFLNNQEVMWLSFPEKFKSNFNDVFKSSFRTDAQGTLALDFDQFESVGDQNIYDFSLTSPIPSISLPSNFYRSVFSPANFENIKQMYSQLYDIEPNSDELQVHTAYCQYLTAKLNNKVYGSFKSRAKNTSIILAQLNNEIRPARINFFAKHNAVIKGVTITHLLVSLNWFERHEQQFKLGKPVTVWHYDLFCDAGAFNFIPVHFILNRTVSLVDKLDAIHGNVLLVSPYI